MSLIKWEMPPHEKETRFTDLDGHRLHIRRSDEPRFRDYVGKIDGRRVGAWPSMEGAQVGLVSAFREEQRKQASERFAIEDRCDELGYYMRKLRAGQITHLRRALQMYAKFQLRQKRGAEHPVDKQYHQDAIDATDRLNLYLLKGGKEPE